MKKLLLILAIAFNIKASNRVSVQTTSSELTTSASVSCQAFWRGYFVYYRLNLETQIPLFIVYKNIEKLEEPCEKLSATAHRKLTKFLNDHAKKIMAGKEIDPDKRVL